MSDDLLSNLQNYKLQLQQVDAALTTSPDDEELLKLKHDLNEVINLTNELIRSQLPDEKKAEHVSESDNLLYGGNSYDEIPLENIKKVWKVGERCLALWVDDGQYYEAVIESIEDGEVSVMFDDYDDPVVTTLEFLKEISNDKASKMRKQPSSKLREYQKKKKLKKQIRFKQLEEEREVEKNKWIAFSSKTYKKGMQKKSIFASPDNINGRVGIGTCGVAGRGMTDYQHAEKHKK